MGISKDPGDWIRVSSSSPKELHWCNLEILSFQAKGKKAKKLKYRSSLGATISADHHQSPSSVLEQKTSGMTEQKSPPRPSKAKITGKSDNLHSKPMAQFKRIIPSFDYSSLVISPWQSSRSSGVRQNAPFHCLCSSCLSNRTAKTQAMANYYPMFCTLQWPHRTHPAPR